jgi:hypothetical protein
MTVFALVDGFNLYHAIDDFVKRDDAKWLNLLSLLQGACVLKTESLRKAFFFTAIPPWSADKRIRHETLLDVYRDQGVNLTMGKFKATTKRCLANCRLEFPIYQEKQTDANITMALTRIAKENLCNVVILLTGDSDQVPAIEYAKEINPALHIRLVLPPNRHAKELMGLCPDHIRLNGDHFMRHRLPETYSRRDGKGSILCPGKWRSSSSTAVHGASV